MCIKKTPSLPDLKFDTDLLHQMKIRNTKSLILKFKLKDIDEDDFNFLTPMKNDKIKKFQPKSFSELNKLTWDYCFPSAKTVLQRSRSCHFIENIMIQNIKGNEIRNYNSYVDLSDFIINNKQERKEGELPSFKRLPLDNKNSKLTSSYIDLNKFYQREQSLLSKHQRALQLAKLPKRRWCRALNSTIIKNSKRQYNFLSRNPHMIKLTPSREIKVRRPLTDTFTIPLEEIEKARYSNFNSPHRQYLYKKKNEGSPTSQASYSASPTSQRSPQHANSNIVSNSDTMFENSNINTPIFPDPNGAPINTQVFTSNKYSSNNSSRISSRGVINSPSRSDSMSNSPKYSPQSNQNRETERYDYPISPQHETPFGGQNSNNSIPSKGDDEPLPFKKFAHKMPEYLSEVSSFFQETNLSMRKYGEFRTPNSEKKKKKKV